MLPKNLAFVDVETTGMRVSYDRVIEIGILRVEENHLVNTFHSLINPQCYLPPEIELMTGIKADELENAPTFRAVKDEILEVLSDCIFVAHNVRFDYGLLKHELKRLETSFSPRHFCTVKLSKYLFPHYKRHNLDSLIQRFNLNCPNRHRAFDDAKVLWDFFQMVQQQFPPKHIKSAIDMALKKPSLPPTISPKTIDKLPETPGVYIFYNSQNAPLYVGKSINIKERVLSHFQNNHSSSIEMRISNQIERTETIQTAGELGALLKESALIKTLKPLYNRKLRLRKKLIILKRTKKNGYETVSMKTLSTINGTEIDQIIGVFKSQKQAKDFLISLAKEYGLCEKILGLEKTKGACFGYRLNRCKGACINEEKQLNYNMRFVMAISKHKIKPWPFKGPIAIEETDPLEDKTEQFLFDKWCYLGAASSAPSPLAGEGGGEGMMLFDNDTYRILETYLRVKKNWKNIKTVPKYEAII